MARHASPPATAGRGAIRCRPPTGKRLVDDVVIGDWSPPWNAKPEKRVPDAPELRASDPRGFGQVGCIYTAQGFEYDWAGVILGPDFVRRNGRWVARCEHSRDPAVKKADELPFAALIRNTYKVLLTRGMCGVGVFRPTRRPRSSWRR
ncbi:DNA/RNA helicase domain-containing protein [Saccharomonospora azurea]|uniref:DNA/RNA helicase domain-containing protein n=1 Tax=Saccharomonospora azurea TaxID=40988 RepID=UPI003D910675